MGSGEKVYFRVASASKRQNRNHFIAFSKTWPFKCWYGLNQDINWKTVKLKTENGKIHKQIILLYSPYHGLSNALKIIVIRFLDRENGLKQEKTRYFEYLKTVKNNEWRIIRNCYTTNSDALYSNLQDGKKKFGFI